MDLLELVFLFLSNIYPGVEWLGHMVVLFFHLYNILEMTNYGTGEQMKGYQGLRGREQEGSGCGHERSLW